MDSLIGGAVVGALVGAVGGLVVFVVAAFQKPRVCPECNTPAPKFRKPKNTRQMLWGGWSCEECGCELDRKGRKIEDS